MLSCWTILDERSVMKFLLKYKMLSISAISWDFQISIMSWCSPLKIGHLSKFWIFRFPECIASVQDLLLSRQKAHPNFVILLFNSRNFKIQEPHKSENPSETIGLVHFCWYKNEIKSVACGFSFVLSSQVQKFREKMQLPWTR